MTGIDGEFALLQTVWADLSVNSKNTTAKNQARGAIADLKAFVREHMEGVIASQYARNYAFAA